jgi:hypothetical protein
MTKNTKILLGLAVAGAVGYFIYSRKKAGKSLNPFANSSNYAGNDFFNADGPLRYCPPNSDEVWRKGRCTCIDKNGIPRGSCGRRTVLNPYN